MSPRPAPDLTLRRERITRLTRQVAEAEGWAAVTTRRLAAELGVTQPVLYSAFASRQDLLDAVALDGFTALSSALEAVPATPLARMGAYLDFAAAHPRTYEAMFSLPSQLHFGDDTHAPLGRAFAAVREAFPPTEDRDGDDVRAEVAWSTLHGLVTLGAGGRLPPERARARLQAAHRMLTRP
ncbi:TetR/AcrR family transcriptional regulator [Kineococcus rhizosphaerae]|uniref:TetR family transcriptional regulator n=1 Tax=Kineococcus rhizosphaerae TaxID=559628 RepID=A0A2T0R0A6_9ACTN|nr:TetR/AcrR family transcriptional regulator [Kineococcus rhizosphaerae]PRY12534.1 TetR family transcriptional regulator [Kineococcus rhizosphaerae]